MPISTESSGSKDLSTAANIPSLKGLKSVTIRLDSDETTQTMRDCLDATGLTQTAFANMIGVHVNTLYMWLTGKHVVPRAFALAAASVVIMRGVTVRFPDLSVTDNPRKSRLRVR